MAFTATNGYVKFWRPILNSPWFHGSTRDVFLWLWANSDFSTGPERGTIRVSRTTLSRELGIPERTIRDCFKRLITAKVVAFVKGAHAKQISLITICNYDSYGEQVTQAPPSTRLAFVKKPAKQPAKQPAKITTYVTGSCETSPPSNPPSNPPSICQEARHEELIELIKEEEVKQEEEEHQHASTATAVKTQNQSQEEHQHASTATASPKPPSKTLKAAANFDPSSVDVITDELYNTWLSMMPKGYTHHYKNSLTFPLFRLAVEDKGYEYLIGRARRYKAVAESGVLTRIKNPYYWLLDKDYKDVELPAEIEKVVRVFKKKPREPWRMKGLMKNE